MKMIYYEVFILLMGVIVNQNGFSSSPKTQNSRPLPQNEDTTNHLTRQKVIEIKRQQNHSGVFVVPNEFEVIDSRTFDKYWNFWVHPEIISNIKTIRFEGDPQSTKELKIKQQSILGKFEEITFRNCKNLTIDKDAFCQHSYLIGVIEGHNKWSSPLDSYVNQIEFSNCGFSADNKGIQNIEGSIGIRVDQMDGLPDNFCALCKIKKVTFTNVINTIGNNCFDSCWLPNDFPLDDSNKLAMSIIPDHAFFCCSWFGNGRIGRKCTGRDFYLPDTWVIIGKGAFTYGHLFKSLEGGMNLSRVGEAAFAFNELLKYVSLSGATHFEDRAFAGCDNLQSISFKKGSTFGKGIFSGCRYEFIIELPEVTLSDLERITEGLMSDRTDYVGPIIFCPHKVTEV